MQHLVRYTMPGGHHEYRDAVSLEEAARLVETARNDYGASDAQIFREVPIEFKVQYRVTVADAAVPEAPAAAPETPAAPPVSDPAPTPPAMPPVAQPSEPPPGAMPLSARPVAPSTDESSDAEAEGESAPENVTPIGGDGATRRTLFGRS